MNIESTQQLLNGTAAVVTGGARGLGRVLARGLAGAGAAVGLIARSSDQLAESVSIIEEAGGVAVAASADLADPDAAAAAMARPRKQLEHIDLLVNNAGVNGPVGPAWEVAEKDWWRTVEVNLRGAEVCSRLVLPDMIARRRGRIVNITSRAGVYRWPLLSAYSVSKAAVVKYVENLAQKPSDTASRFSACTPVSCRLVSENWRLQRPICRWGVPRLAWEAGSVSSWLPAGTPNRTGPRSCWCALRPVTPMRSAGAT